MNLSHRYINLNNMNPTLKDTMCLMSLIFEEKIGLILDKKFSHCI